MKEVHARLKGPKVFNSFCLTRFASYTKDVIKSFNTNFMLVAKELETSEELERYRKLMDPKFILRMNGLHDIYEELGRLSKKIQDPDIFIWTIEDCIQNCLLRINTIREFFLELTNFCQHDLSFNTATKEMMQNRTYKGIPLHRKQPEVNEGTGSDAAKYSYTVVY